MKWVGLSGGLGTGKSTAARLLRELGMVTIDADQLAKDVVSLGSAGLKSVVTQFGSEILDSSGNLDRQKLAKKVFSDKQKLEKLEAIIHPLVQEQVEKIKSQEEKKGTSVVFYDVPLLFEKKISGFDAVIVVACSLENQIRRLRRRNNWTEEEIKNRLSHQVPLSEKMKQADYVIHNDGSEADLKKKISEILTLMNFKN